MSFSGLKKIGVLAFFSLLLCAPALAQVYGGSTQYGGSPDLGVDYPAAAGLSSGDVRITTARIIKVALSLLGAVFLVIVFYGGYLWMTAGGNDEKTGAARKWIYSGVIGLAIILSAYSITSFIVRGLTNATTSGSPVRSFF